MDQLNRSARRITLVLLLVQSMGSAAIISMATVAAIIGADLSGRTSLAGLPSSVSQLGVAASALLWSLVTDRIGRRLGLALGILIGALGAALALFAVLIGSFVLLLLSVAIVASAQACFNLGRFTAAEVNPPASRGRAVAFVVLGGTAGSVLGPYLVALSGRIATSFGMTELAGPYGVSLVLFLLASITLLLFLKPEPKQLAETVALHYPVGDVMAKQLRPLSVIFRQPAVIAAMASMIIGYAVMVMLMGITSLHMRHLDHSLDLIALVFSAHTLGMFAFSMVTGWMCDRWGRKPVMLSGAVLLLVSCLLAPLSPLFVPIAAALFLLGLGWNFTYVAGSTLLSDQLSPGEKARTQGVNDMLIGLVSASSSVASGLVLATAGYGAMGLIGAVLSGLLVVILLWYHLVGGEVKAVKVSG